MSCAQIRGYAEGWGRFQSRIHGGSQDKPTSEVEDVSDEDRDFLGSTLRQSMGLDNA
jgi:hypothetical protein